MVMEIFLDQNYQDQFLVQQNISGAFLQSSFWEKFLIAQGKNVWRLSFKDQERLLGTCLLGENKLFMGKSYLASPKGPIFYQDLPTDQLLELSQLFFSKIRDLTINTKKYQEIFVRLEPKNFLGIKELRQSIDISPRETWLTNLTKPLLEILKNSHSKTRYNISLAQKKGIQIDFVDKQEAIKVFIELLQKTAERQKIGIHANNYFKLWAENLFTNNFSELAIASLDNQPIAANLMVKFGKMVTYVHGASDYSQRGLMAPHYLHWRCIERYRAQGYELYDWWGIAPQDGSKPGWQGVSRFKEGFMGERQSSLGTQDFVYDDAWYSFYNTTRKLWRKLR